MTEPHAAQVTLVNELGMHLRAAGRFVQLASSFTSTIRVEHDQAQVDGKSIMGLLSLAVACDESITIFAQGDDASSALGALVDLVARGFEENG